MIKTAASHVDHGLTEQQLSWILTRFADREAFFIETVELPESLGTVPCGLYGPAVGDLPITETVYFAARGDRSYPSRLVDKEPRLSRKVTVIAGPHEGIACMLYTAFGGPLAPQEPGDIRAQMRALADDFAKGFEPERFAGIASVNDVDPATVEARTDAFIAQLHALRAKLVTSQSFWSEHALAGRS